MRAAACDRYPSRWWRLISLKCTIFENFAKRNRNSSPERPPRTLCRGGVPSAARSQSAGADHARGVFRDVVGGGLDMAGDQGASLLGIATDGGLHQGPVLAGLVARMRPEQRRQIAVALGAIEQRISHGQQCRRA